MKRAFYTLLTSALLCLAAAGCGANAAQTQADMQSENRHLQSTIFTYGQNQYDIAEREPMVTSIMSCTHAGKFIVVEGHCGPRNAVYSIFNTENLAFEKDIIGTNLIWRDGDLSTAVYSFWSEIFDYEGNLIGDAALEEDSFIRSLQFSENGIEAVIATADGASITKEFSLNG